jgi:hypothetical protein
VLTHTVPPTHHTRYCGISAPSRSPSSARSGSGQSAARSRPAVKISTAAMRASIAASHHSVSTRRPLQTGLTAARTSASAAAASGRSFRSTYQTVLTRVRWRNSSRAKCKAMRTRSSSSSRPRYNSVSTTNSHPCGVGASPTLRCGLSARKAASATRLLARPLN